MIQQYNRKLPRHLRDGLEVQSETGGNLEIANGQRAGAGNVGRIVGAKIERQSLGQRDMHNLVEQYLAPRLALERLHVLHAANQLHSADTLSTYFLPCAERQISALTGELPVGHTILSIAGLAWKHERMSAVTMPRKILPAPVAGTGPVKAVRDQVESVLENCAEPTVGRAIFVRRASGWQQLDSSSVEP